MLDVTGPLQIFAGVNDELGRQAYELVIATPKCGSFKTSSGVSRAKLRKGARSHGKPDRRTVFATGLAAASLMSNTGASAQQAAGGSAEARLRELGIELPKVPAPAANFVPAARLGNVIFLAGTGPIKPDGKLATGKVGVDVTLDEANQHARLVGLARLAVMRQELGSLDKVVRVGRVFGMVNAAPNFTDHPKVINGCSDLFVEVFGDRGRQARCAVGMASCPPISASKLKRLSKLRELL
jgi:enamine deaminase RidA (YjgF/YER057c/UK114 family)